MDRFFSDRNIERYRRLACAATIERYRRLACAATTDIERTRLLNLMVQEEDNYIVLEKAEGFRSAEARCLPPSRVVMRPARPPARC